MFKRDRNVIVFIILLIMRIPLSHIIGDNGLGYLSGSMEMFIILSLLFGSGYRVTMQGMMRERIRRDQYRNAAQVYSFGSRIAYICAFAMLVINIAGYDLISSKILGDGGQRLSYLFTGPAVAISILISLYKGYLLGTENTGAVVIGEIFEAVCDGTFMIIGSLIGRSYGVKIAALLQNDDVSAMYGAMGVMAGLCAGQLLALIAFIVMTIIYQRTFRHMCKSDTSRKSEYRSDVTSRLISGCISDGVQCMLVQVIVIILIVIYRHHGIKAGEENTNSLIGAFYGKYLSVAGILAGLSVLVIPSGIRGVIAANSEGDDIHASDRLSKLLARVFYFTIPAVIFTTMLVPSVISALFTGMVTTATTVMSVGMSVVFLYACMYLFMSLLVRLNYHKEVMFMSAIALIGAVVLGFIFVTRKDNGLVGMALVLMIFYGVNALLCLFVLLRNMKFRINLLTSFVFPLIAAGITGVLIKLLSGVLLDAVGGILTLIICIIPAWIIYNIGCIFLRVVSAGQMEKKLFGRIFIAIGQNMGVY